MLAYDPVKGVSGFGIFFVGLGIIADVASYSAGYRTRDQRPNFS